MTMSYPHNPLTYPQCGHRSVPLLSAEQRAALVARIERWQTMVEREGVR